MHPTSKSFEAVWNNTFIWYKTGIPGADSLNVIQVANKDLQIFTKNTNGIKDDTLVVNLTKPVTINLPFNLWSNAATKALGNLSFTLPTMTLTFRDLNAGSYPDQGANATTALWIHSSASSRNANTRLGRRNRSIMAGRHLSA